MTLLQITGSSAVSAQGTSTEDGSSFDLTTENLMRHIFERPDPLSKWMDLNFVDPLGFDVEDVFRTILTIGGDNYIKDTKLMVAFAVERGNNLENIATRSSADAISEIKRLISKYGLVTEATSPQSITLDRVCLAFPPLACNYMPLARKTVVDKKALLSVCSDYPLDMMHKAFATVIPNSLSEACQKTIIDAHCLHEAHYCAIIGRSKDGSSKKPRDYIGSSP